MVRRLFLLVALAGSAACSALDVGWPWDEADSAVTETAVTVPEDDTAAAATSSWNVSIQAEPERPLAAAPASGGAAPKLVPLAPSATGLQADGEYRIGPEDLLEVSIVGEPDVQRVELRVGPQGLVDVPYAGRIRAAGLTTDGVKRVLEEKLDAFWVKPEVVVFLREYRSNTANLFGEVARPGPYKLTHRNTLMEVISRAGGFTPLADTKDVRILRQEAGSKKILTVNVRSIIEDGRIDLDPMLRPGDVIQVPQKLL